MNLLKCTLILFFILSCATSEPEKNYTKTINKGATDVANAIFALANKCWAKEVGWTDGARVDLKDKPKESFILTVTRISKGQDIKDPALTVDINQVSAKISNVIVNEGNWGESPKGFIKDLKRWFDGDMDCR